MAFFAPTMAGSDVSYLVYITFSYREAECKDALPSKVGLSPDNRTVRGKGKCEMNPKQRANHCSRYDEFDNEGGKPLIERFIWPDRIPVKCKQLLEWDSTSRVNLGACPD